METAVDVAKNIYERRNQLVKSQIQKLADMALQGALLLPVSHETVLAHVDTNYSFYFGTFTRRSHSEQHSQSGPLPYETVELAYMQSIAHIGHMVNRGMPATHQTLNEQDDRWELIAA